MYIKQTNAAFVNITKTFSNITYAMKRLENRCYITILYKLASNLV